MQGLEVRENPYVVSRRGPYGSSLQSSAAASFFAKASAQLVSQSILPSPSVALSSSSSSETQDPYPTCFRALLQHSPPPLPPSILRRLEDHKDSQFISSSGKIRVLLRFSKSTSTSDIPEESSFIIDDKKSQVQVFDTHSRLSHLPSAPKIFSFDGVFNSETSSQAINESSLSDVLTSVLNGQDGSVFCFGHASLGKSATMIGSDRCSKDVGVIPSAISWLYKAIRERKAKYRFSLRVSALEISGASENMKDLLLGQSSDDVSPSIYLSSPTNSFHQSLSEVKASSPQVAAYYLDAALSQRSSKGSHFLFTIYVYQIHMNSNVGGRSRLHLFDLSSCERVKSGKGLTLASLANVLLSIFNGSKHYPSRDSRLSDVLRDVLGNVKGKSTLIAHVSPDPSHYSETLHTISFASRLHRSRRKRLRKFKGSGLGSGTDVTTSGTSASELSCDTVIYKAEESERPGKGSFSGRRPQGSRILTNGAIARSSYSSQNNLPSIPEVNKMPLHGKVPRRTGIPQTNHHLINHLINHPISSSSSSCTFNNEFFQESKYSDKVSRVHSWVEQIHVSPLFHALTQFKTLSEKEVQFQKEDSLNGIHQRKNPGMIPLESTKLHYDSRSVLELNSVSYQVDDLSHPLRVLSEENLTIVSSFGGSLNELKVDEDENEEENENLTRFMDQIQIPNEGLAHSEDFFNQKFKEFEKLIQVHKSINTTMRKEHKEEEIDNKQELLTQKELLSEKDHLSEKRVLTEKKLSENRDLLTEKKLSDNRDLLTEKKLSENRDLLTEKKLSENRDLLTERKLSENKELLVEKKLSDNRDLLTEKKLSDNRELYTLGKLSEEKEIQDHQKPWVENEIVISRSYNPFSSFEEYVENKSHLFPISKKRFSFRFFKFFNSKKKDTKKHIHETTKRVESSIKGPASLANESLMSSMDTEWEYQNDFETTANTADRKSSGYETSSYDSNEEDKSMNQLDFNKIHPNNNSLDEMSKIDGGETPNNNNNNNVEIIQYDEIDIHRFESRKTRIY